MTRKQATFSIIIVSIIFAIAIVIASFIFADTDYSQTVTLILIAIWFIPFLYFSKLETRKPE